jgi:hypothetical protein
MKLQAGIARAVITPPLSLPHAGWGAQTHVLPSGVEADLWSTVLVLTDGNTMSVIVDLDLCSLSPRQSEELRRRVASALEIDRTNIRISVTHTHAGPYLWTDYYEEKKHIRLSYLEHIMEQTVGCALQALRLLTEVTVGAGYGTCGIPINRRQRLEDGRVVCGMHKEGYTDPTVSVIRFDDSSGSTVASIVHYSMHPTILGPANQQVSPDYPGALKRTVEANIGGMCLFLQGAAGDIGPGAVGYTADIAVMRRVGRTLGCTASSVLLGVSTHRTELSFEGIVESGCTLAYWSERTAEPNDDLLRTLSTTIRFNVKPCDPPDEAKRQAAEMKARLLELQTNSGTSEEIKDATFRLKRLTMAADHSDLYYGIEHKDIEVHLIAIGGIVLIGMPLEPFSRIGAQIRERSPFPYTLFSGYTNGWEGYFPTTDEYTAGGYEVETTPFAPGSEEILLESVEELLHQLKSSRN